MERENDLRKNEIRSLEERQQKDNQVKLHVWVNGMGCDPLSISHFEFCRVTFYVEEMRSGTGPGGIEGYESAELVFNK